MGTRVIEYKCAVGIVYDFMRKGYISTAEYDMISAELKEKYGITNEECAD